MGKCSIGLFRKNIQGSELPGGQVTSSRDWIAAYL